MVDYGIKILRIQKLTCIGHAVNIYDDYAMELEDKKSDFSPDDYEVPKTVDIDTEDMLEPIIEKNDVSLEEVVNSEDADQLGKSDFFCPMLPRSVWNY